MQAWFQQNVGNVDVLLSLVKQCFTETGILGLTILPVLSFIGILINLAIKNT